VDIEKAKLYRDFMDFPSGVVMSVFTFVMMALCVASFAIDRQINGSILSVYGTVLGFFAYNKTKKSLKKLDKEKPSDSVPG
jgi:hypothetical protein